MANERTQNLGLIIFPNISGVYQREIRMALVSAEDCNMVLIDAAIGAIREVLQGLSTVASTGDYTDLLNTPTIPGIATQEIAGTVKPDGDTILIDENGVIRAAVKVAIATTEQAGIVKPDGTTITADKDGTIKATVEVNIATAERAGVVKPDGESITVDPDGTIRSAMKDTYSKEEIDAMMKELSEMLISDSDLNSMGLAVNLLMDTEDTYSEIGTDLITLEIMVDELLN